MWSARRALHIAATMLPSELVESRGKVVGHSMFMQFQAHVGELVTPFVLPATITARSHFRYLPAAGVIPVPEEVTDTDAEATRFFAGLTYRGPAFINGAQLEHLIRESAEYPPIDTERGEFLWLYRVRENRMAIDFRSTVPQPRSFIVFASGHISYRADARFDAAYWNYGNYALMR
jgi:hypothetical protein